MDTAGHKNTAAAELLLLQQLLQQLIQHLVLQPSLQLLQLHCTLVEAFQLALLN